MSVGFYFCIYNGRIGYLASVPLDQAHSRWLINVHRMYQIKIVNHVSWL